MSWTQGFIDANELPPVIIRWAEKKAKELFDKDLKLSYMTWFDLSKPVYLDFGESYSFQVNCSIDEFYGQFKSEKEN